MMMTTSTMTAMATMTAMMTTTTMTQMTTKKTTKMTTILQILTQRGTESLFFLFLKKKQNKKKHIFVLVLLSTHHDCTGMVCCSQRVQRIKTKTQKFSDMHFGPESLYRSARVELLQLQLLHLARFGVLPYEGFFVLKST